MRPISEFDYSNLEFDLVVNNKGVEYVDISAAFDIETTNHDDGTTVGAFMYVFMIQLGSSNSVYYGRTWDEFEVFFERIATRLALEPDVRILPVYVHNLAYEFQFIRHLFDWSGMFALAERKPIKCTTVSGIEFRCSYLLSGMSLERTANSIKSPLAKMVGDLDYSTPRNSKTPLSADEMRYCEHDVRIVTAYIDEQREQYGDVLKIPNTNTGRVRRYVRDACYYTSKQHKKSSRGKFQRYRRIMEQLTLTPEVYELASRAFIGGFTHANPIHAGKVLEGVHSIDLASAYPAVMLSELFPMGRFKPVDVKNASELTELLNTHCVLFEVHFRGLKSSFPFENYISESKCQRLESPVVANGRVVEAAELSTTITEVDFDIIRRCYTWNGVGIGRVYASPKGYLPKPIVDATLTLFEEKTTLKDVEGREADYLLSKGMLNSVYGMTVTDVMRDDIDYCDGWTVEPPNVEDKISEYNDQITRFLFYPWGLWVTAYTRRNLWSGILAMGSDYVYSDTDSIKFLNRERYTDYIATFNATVQRKLEFAMNEHGISTKRLSPRNIHGDADALGAWDYEGCYDRFKTLGAKRYMFEQSGKISITVAGLNKKRGAKYLETTYGVDGAFDAFDHLLHVPKQYSGRLTHTYTDTEHSAIIEDEHGNVELMTSLSSVHLTESDFNMSIGEEYLQFLSNLRRGVLYTGEHTR